MEQLFTHPDAWHGGFYELGLDYGPDSTKIEAGLQTLWGLPDLEGCYLRHDVEPSSQRRVSPTLKEQESAGHLYGLARVPGGKRIPCGTILIKEEQGTSWLVFYLPLGGLDEAYDIGAYPFNESESASRRWREPLDQWLAFIGQTVYAKAPFRLGLIGVEVSGEVDVEEIQQSGVPAARRDSYLCPRDGILKVYATNQW